MDSAFVFRASDLYFVQLMCLLGSGLVFRASDRFCGQQIVLLGMILVFWVADSLIGIGFVFWAMYRSQQKTKIARKVCVDPIVIE